jgi:hypothetical protein
MISAFLLGMILRPECSNSVKPTDSSIRLMDLVSAGCVTCSFSEAAVSVLFSITAISYSI